jgi:hypothetical protein
MWEIRPNKACIAQIWFDWDAPRYGAEKLRNPISGECDIVKVYARFKRKRTSQGCYPILTLETFLQLQINNTSPEYLSLDLC